MTAVGALFRTRAAPRAETTPWLVLGSLVAVSVAARGLLAFRHTAARYLPDEYVYASLSRSLAHGHLQVHGEPAQFPALLQPVLAAPLWALLPVYDAYRLVQLGNAVAASLVVVPLWLLARRLDLPARASALACVYALLVPMLAWIPVTISDFVAYPIVIGAVAAAVHALDEPSPRRQSLFLVLALLATLGRVQYFVLVPAYLAGAVAVDRRRAARRHAIVFAGLAPALVGVALALTGFYSLGSQSVDAVAIARWVPVQAFLLAVVGGAVIVPGAVAFLLGPRGRRETAFATVFGSLALLLLVEASVYTSHDGRFRERYLFALLPLVAVAFALHLRLPGRRRSVVLVTAAALILAAARLPISTYTPDAQSYDSQGITAAWLLQRHIGATAASAAVAGFVTLAALLATLIAYRGRGAAAALPAAIVAAALATAGAVWVDISHAPRLTNPTWIDDAARGAPVTAVATPSSGRVTILKQLYFNPDVDREVVLPGAQPSDTYATGRTSVGTDGQLRGVHGLFLFDETGTQARFANARLVARHGDYALFRADGVARLRLLVENERGSGLLAPLTRLRAWPLTPPGAAMRVRFTLSRVGVRGRARVQLNGRRFVVPAGRSRAFECTSRHRPLDVRIFSPDLYFVGDAPVTVRLSGIAVGDVRGRVADTCAAI